MRTVFLGTPAFAVPALKRLIDNSYEVCAVFTQPDRPSGRGHKLHPPPVKILALERGIPVYQPEKIRREENRPFFEELKPDIIVVAAYGQILPAWLLESARFGSVNIHASLLPRYRGAAPISWAIINGETVTGVTTMLMAEKLDAGPILLQREKSIPLNMTAGELTDALSELGADLLIQTLIRLGRNEIKPVTQDESQVTWAPRITKEVAAISWQKNSSEIHNLIRGTDPWPGAYTEFRGERLHLWRSLPGEPATASPAQPGTYLGVSKEAFRVQCGGGTVLNVFEVQRPAKNRVTGREFAIGARLADGDRIFS